jgi:hypothetical protein
MDDHTEDLWAGLPPGVWAWLVLLVVVNATWISLDLWLRAHGFEYLTTEFKEGLRMPIMGPVLAFLTAGTFAALVWHFYTK